MGIKRDQLPVPHRLSHGITEMAMLATMVRLLRSGQTAAAALLVDVERVEIRERDPDFERQTVLELRVDEELWDRFTDEVVDQILVAMPLDDIALVLAPPEAPSTWREDAAKTLGIGPTNQASRAPWTLSQGVLHDWMRFRDESEILVYEALKTKQLALPANDTVGISVNPSIRVREHTWEPDFIVTYQGRAIAVEVDGASHGHRYASDRTRDELLGDAGLTVYRIPVEDAQKPDDLVQHVDRIVSRLARSG